MLDVSFFGPQAQVDETLDIYVEVASMGATTISVESEIYRAGTWELLTTAELIYESYDFRRDAIRIVPNDARQLISRYEGEFIGGDVDGNHSAPAAMETGLNQL